MQEETGVVAHFAAVLAVRQAHGFAFGKSDLFFCCALVPQPGQDELKPCVSVGQGTDGVLLIGLCS